MVDAQPEWPIVGVVWVIWPVPVCRLGRLLCGQLDLLLGVCHVGGQRCSRNDLVIFLWFLCCDVVYAHVFQLVPERDPTVWGWLDGFLISVS